MHYANAMHVHTYSAIVAFVLAKKRKPRGEELHPLLHAAWGKYSAASARMSEVSHTHTHKSHVTPNPTRSKLAPSPPPRKLKCYPSLTLQGSGEETSEEMATAYALSYGDQVTFEKTNTYKLSDFTNATNHGKLVNKEVGKAKQFLIAEERDKGLRRSFAYIGREDLIDRADVIEKHGVEIPVEVCRRSCIHNAAARFLATHKRVAPSASPSLRALPSTLPHAVHDAGYRLCAHTARAQRLSGQAVWRAEA